MTKARNIFFALCGMFALFVAPAFAADDWANIATVSNTTVTNHLCFHDGTDIVCNTPTSTVTVGGSVSATTLNATQVCDETGANCKDVSAGWGSADALADTDGNTKIQVEETSNEDKVRIDTGGTERVVIDSSGLNITSGKLKINGVAGGAGTDSSVSEDDPEVDTLTADKWCVANGDGTAIDCTTDNPSIAAINDIGDVDTTGVATNNVLTFDGSGWVDASAISLTSVVSTSISGTTVTGATVAGGTITGTTLTTSGNIEASGGDITASGTVTGSTNIATPLMKLTPVAGGAGYTASTSVAWDDVASKPDNVTDLAGLATTDGGIVVGNGSAFVLETGATARTSLGLGAASTVDFSILQATQVCDEAGSNCKDISEGWGSADTLADTDGNTKIQVEESPNEDKVRIDTGGTERLLIDSTGLTLATGGSIKLPLTTGGAGYTASTTISVDWDDVASKPDNVTDLAGLATTDGGIVVGNGSAFVLETGATARASLGLDTSDNVTFADITGELQTAAQPNITSVGTLTSGTISGDLTVDTTDLFVDASANKVGVGTASPNARLHVNGALQIAGNTETCTGAGDIGKMKYNSSTGRFQICRP